MSTYAYTNATQTAVGTSPATLYTNATTASIIIGLTISNVTAAAVKATVAAVGANAGKTVQLAPGAVMNPLNGEKWILTGTQTVIVTSDTAASLDCIAHILTVT